MRLIDADALKADYRMADECKDCETNVRNCEYDRTYTKMDFCGLLDDAPTVPQWIPVTEMLPEESDDYLCSYGTLTGHFVGIDIYEAEKKEFGFYSDDEQGNEVWHPVTNVVAWMPLPEPWRAES